jgi:hypothetical protein
MEIKENEFRKTYMINPENNEEIKVVFLKKIVTEAVNQDTVDNNDM